MTAGFLRGDGTVITDQYVRVFTQKKDLAGNWVVDDEAGSGYTDNAGIFVLDITPGYYIVGSNFNGYNWGTASDLNGMASVAMQSGQETRLIVSLGQLQVGIKDVNGNPLAGKYVAVSFQTVNVSGSAALGDKAASGYTDNTGIYAADLTPGKYAISFDDVVLYNVEVSAGRITFSDGAQWQFK